MELFSSRRVGKLGTGKSEAPLSAEKGLYYPTMELTWSQIKMATWGSSVTPNVQKAMPLLYAYIHDLNFMEKVIQFI